MPSPNLPSSLPQMDSVSASLVPSEHFVYTHFSTSHIFLWLQVKDKDQPCGIFLCTLAACTQLFFNRTWIQFGLSHCYIWLWSAMEWENLFRSRPGRTSDAIAFIWLVPSVKRHLTKDLLFCFSQNIKVLHRSRPTFYKTNRSSLTQYLYAFHQECTAYLIIISISPIFTLKVPGD